MTGSINYTVPFQNFQVTTLANGTVVSVLPRTSFPKMIIGVNCVFSSNPVTADFKDTTRINQWGNTTLDFTMYLENINPSNAIWRDYNTFIRPPVFIIDPPLEIPANTLIIGNYANLNSSVLTKLLTTFYVVRSAVYS